VGQRQHGKGSHKSGNGNDNSGNRIEPAIQRDRREAIGHLDFATQLRHSDGIPERLPNNSQLRRGFRAEAKPNQARE